MPQEALVATFRKLPHTNPTRQLRPQKSVPSSVYFLSPVARAAGPHEAKPPQKLQCNQQHSMSCILESSILWITYEMFVILGAIHFSISQMRFALDRFRVVL